MSRKITFPLTSPGVRANSETGVKIVSRLGDGYEVRTPRLRSDRGYLIEIVAITLTEAREYATAAANLMRVEIALAYLEASITADPSGLVHDGATVEQHDEALRIDRDRDAGVSVMRSREDGPCRTYGRALRNVRRTWDIAIDHRAVIEALHAEALNEDRPRRYGLAAWSERLAAEAAQRPLSAAIAARTRIPEHGTTTLDVMPPKPCGLTGCVGELWIRVGNDGPTRVHLNEAQRVALIAALDTRPSTVPLLPETLAEAMDQLHRTAQRHPTALGARPPVAGVCSCKPHPVFGHQDGCRYEGTGAAQNGHYVAPAPARPACSELPGCRADAHSASCEVRIWQHERLTRAQIFGYVSGQADRPTSTQVRLAEDRLAYLARERVPYAVAEGDLLREIIGRAQR